MRQKIKNRLDIKVLNDESQKSDCLKIKTLESLLDEWIYGVHLKVYINGRGTAPKVCKPPLKDEKGE